MRNTRPVRAALVGLAILAWCSPAGAQIYEAVGIRAQGMGGAFVAVADDATATWWNPAGLTAGASFGAVLERSHVREPADPVQNVPAWRAEETGLALVFPTIGLSYYRLRVNEIRRIPATGNEPPGRQDLATAGLGIRSVAISQYGASVGQSVGDHVVFASTLKLVRSGETASDDASGTDPLGRAAALAVPTETHGDLDLGAMASLGYVRLGLSVKHVNEPKFGPDERPFELRRQARAGVALLGGRLGPLDAVTGAVDADLTTTATATGEVKHRAAGLETWLFGRRLGVRAGINSAGGDHATKWSAGFSLGPLTGLYLDGAVVLGSSRQRGGWALGARVTL